MIFRAKGKTVYLYSGNQYAGRIAKLRAAPGFELHPAQVSLNVAELEVIAAAIQRCDQLAAKGKAVDSVDWK